MNTQDFLKNLGKKSQQLPSNNEALKAKVVADLRPQSVILRRPVRLWWVGLAGVAAVFVLYLVGPSLLKDKDVYYEQSAVQTEKYDLGLQSAATGLGVHDEDALNKTIRSPLSSPVINDTREFLKMGYNASIKTRKVEKLGTRIQTMVRGYGGRIDYASIGDKNAYVSFVIPKSSLETFKSELQDLVPSRFLTENVNMQNLLSNKQAIEGQTDSANQKLESLRKDRQTLVAKHNSDVGSLQQQINSYSRNISQLQSEATTDTLRQQEIAGQVARLTSQKNSLNQQLANVNYKFQNNLRDIDASISSTYSRLTDLGKQDQQLLNDVETVQGTVSLRWISVLDSVNLYVPIYWVLIIGFSLTIIGFLFYGRPRRAFEMP